LKQLTLLRHAKSSWDDRRLADHDRALDPRGLRDAPWIGARLAELGLKPSLLLTSSALRARQTTDLVEVALRNPALEVQVDAEIYLASPGELLSVLSEQSDDVSNLVLIGHNPGLTILTNMLLPDLKLDNLPTAGAVSLRCDTDSWQDIDAANISLAFYEYPKKGSDPG
jgi:phosphohistidine phosphatase